MERRPRLSAAQWEQMVGFFEENPQVARGYTRSTQARQQASRMWEQLSIILNSEGAGVTKDAKSWSKFWNDYKCKLKKKVHDIRINMEGTGGGPALEEVLTDFEIRLLAVLGENFGGQLQGIAVEPFATRNQEIADNVELIVLNSEDNVVVDPINIFDEGQEEGNRSASLEIPPTDQPSMDQPSTSQIPLASGERVARRGPITQPPTDQPSTSQVPPASGERVTRRGPIRRRHSRQRSTPQTTLDEAQIMLANIETKRVEAEMLNATSYSEMVKLLSQKIYLDQRAVAAQEELGRQIASAINRLAESVQAFTKSVHEPAIDA